jgi:hypothetical protein
MRWVHLGLAITWTLLLVPTLIWWKDSILWIALMSDYALIAAHMAGFAGERAKKEAGDGNSGGS